MRAILKFSFLVSLVFAFPAASWSAVNLTSFGSGTSPAFSVEGGGLTTFGVTQSAANLNIFGADNLQLVGTFAAKDITGQSDFLTITGSSTSTTSNGFTAELVDVNFLVASYTGGGWTGLNGLSSGSTTLTFQSSAIGFDFTNIIGIQMFSGGVGSLAVNATLTGASTFAIPEPSRIVLLGLGLAGLSMRRRRSVVA